MRESLYLYSPEKTRDKGNPDAPNPAVPDRVRTDNLIISSNGMVAVMYNGSYGYIKLAEVS